MKQILHIFAKDVRHSWVDILGALALVTAYFSINLYLWAAYPQWRQGGIESGGWLGRLLPVIVFFIMIAWLVLISSAIHSERLAGDKQFWITRPYEWKKLLAAKLLFVVVFVYLPFLAALFILRAEVGTPQHPDVAASFLGALGSVLSLITVLVLPSAAIASVTTSFVSMMGALLGACTSLMAVTFIQIAMRPDSNPGPLSADICYAVLLLLSGAVVVLQYARRKTRLSIALLIAIPVLICAICLFTPERRPTERTHPPHATAIGPL